MRASRSFLLDWRQFGKTKGRREIGPQAICYVMRLCDFEHLDRIEVTKVTVHKEQEAASADPS